MKIALLCPLALMLACGASPRQTNLEARMAALESRIVAEERQLYDLERDVERTRAIRGASDDELERVRREIVEMRERAAENSREIGRLEARRRALESAAELRRAPSHRELQALRRKTSRLIGKVTPRSARNTLIHDLLAIDVAGTDVDVRKRLRAHRGLSNLARRARKRSSGPSVAEVDYTRLYQRAGKRLDRSGLEPEHPLVRAYLDIDYQAGVINMNARARYARLLRRILRELPAARQRNRAATASAGPPGKTVPDTVDFDEYVRLYHRTAKALKRADLDGDHPLVQQYLRINYQSGIMKPDLRRLYAKRLRHILRALAHESDR